MALNVYQTPVMVLGAIAQEPYHLNLFQMPVMVLGTTEVPIAPMRVTKVDAELYSTSPHVILKPIRMTKVDAELYSTTPFPTIIPMRVTKVDAELYSTLPHVILKPIRVTKVDAELYSTASYLTNSSGSTPKMSHPYAVQPIIAANETRNGSMITFVSQAGNFYKKTLPDVNRYVDSGVMNVRISGRFDESYGNATIP